MAITGLEMIRRDDEGINITGLDSIRQIIETDLPPVSSFAVELLQLVTNARELDHECRLFGAKQHRYQFAPVAGLSAVREFEQRHHIMLPFAYVEFLTQVGNGGAGPDYGLYSLEELEFYNFSLHSGREVPYGSIREEDDYHTLRYHREQSPTVLDASLTEEGWNSICEELDALRYRNEEEAYLRKRRNIYNGALRIVDSFDQNGVFLICAGSRSGEIVTLSEDLSHPRFHGQQFEDFMLSYFKEVVRHFSH